MLDITINGTQRRVAADPDTPLLWVLRDDLALTGTKYGCGAGLCGACMVHIGGAAVASCQIAVNQVGAQDVRTIEGLSKDRSHPVQAAWIAEQVPQCGYCQSGMIMAVAALLASTPKPSDQQIDDSITNICRCGTYPRIRAAIKRAANA